MRALDRREADVRALGMRSSGTRVFLLEDHEVVRRGLKDLFDSEEGFEVVGESGSAKDASARIPALRPDVAVLDGRLPDGSGVDVCRSIRSVDPSIRAIILTSYDDDEALFAAIMAGAAGYVRKQIAGDDLLDVVRKVAEGRSLLDPAVIQRVLDRLRDGGVSEPAELRSLTPQERRILELVAEGLTNRQIGEQLFLAEKTVKNYVTSILRKLGRGPDDKGDKGGVREPRRPAPTGGQSGAARADD
jgi:two-component system, NarL family, response regulator DevR